MLIELKPQTVITMVGPSHSGKSYEAFRIYAYAIQLGLKCKIISSDAIRKELLGLDSTDAIPEKEGFAVSEVTFKKLFSDLEHYTSTPVNTDIIIVDTTGLSKDFRQDLCKAAINQGYANIAMVFNPDISLLRSRSTEEDFKYIESQLKRTREKVLPDFNRRDYLSMYRIANNVDEEGKCKIEYTYKDSSKVLYFSSNSDVVAHYGDVHQQVEEFKKAYDAAVQAGANAHVVIGDWIDKDDEASMKATIDHLYQLVFGEGFNVYLLKGNHEEYVYTKLINPDYVWELNEETRYFTSLEYLLKPENEPYRSKFISLVEASYDFSEIKTNKEWSIASHSPCLFKHLGKRDPLSIRKMRNTRIEWDGSGARAITKIGYVIDQAQTNTVNHIFGHVEVGHKYFKHKNMIAIDQGCVSGGHLTAYIVNAGTGKHTAIHIPSSKAAPELITDFSYFVKPFDKYSVKLTEEEQEVFDSLIRSNPSFISGTMAPAPSKWYEEGEEPWFDLESIDGAVNLLLSRDITELVAQKKHMGSRCQLYLNKTVEDSYAISRNGWRIKIPAIQGILEKYLDRYKDMYTSSLIVDGELLPWSALGRGLIDKDFTCYSQAISNELDLLEDSKLLNEFFPSFDLQQDKKDLEAFNTQLSIYGKHEEPYFEPFGIIAVDGVSMLEQNQVTTCDTFGIAYEVFDISDPQQVEALKMYYNTMTIDGDVEGIVVKPTVWTKGLIPYLKIRNPEYLRLVYGFDYSRNIEKACRQKNIRNKLNISIREQNLNVDLLRASYTNDVETKHNLYKLLITEFTKEKSLDPRL